MKIEFPHHRETIPVDFPKGAIDKAYRAKTARPLMPEKIREVINRTFQNRELQKTLTGRKNAVIVVSDITRYIPYPSFLPFLLKNLADGGIAPEKITFLVATGCHRPATSGEIKKILGGKIAEKYRVLNHDAFTESGLACLGKTRKKTPIYVNRFYLQSDLKILTGLIEPHFMAGFSGGRKSICPGISGYETIKFVHSPRFLESDRARSGILRNNPFHLEITEIAQKAGADLIVNAVLDKNKRLAGLFCGHPLQSFLKGCRLSQELTADIFRNKHDLVITTGGGWPLDLTFYQTIKGIVTAGEIIGNGGTVLVISGMKEGIGSESFVSLVKKFRGRRQFLDFHSRPENFTPDQWQIEELLKVTRKASVYLYSRNKIEPFVERLGIKIIRGNLSAFLKPFLAKKGSVGILTEGPFVLPWPESKTPAGR